VSRALPKARLLAPADHPPVGGAPVTGVTARARDPVSSVVMVAREADMPEDRFYEGDGPGPEAAERFRSMGEMLWLLRRSPHHAGWGPEEVERNLLDASKYLAKSAL